MGFGFPSSSCVAEETRQAYRTPRSCGELPRKFLSQPDFHSVTQKLPKYQTKPLHCQLVLVNFPCARVHTPIRGTRKVFLALRPSPGDASAPAGRTSSITCTFFERAIQMAAHRQKSSSRKSIIAQIRKLSSELGRPPRREEFSVRTGISVYFVMRHFRRWSEALEQAGQQLYYHKVRRASDPMEDWGRVVRSLRKSPTVIEYRREGGLFAPRSFSRLFGHWSDVPQSFREFAATRPQWTDVVQILDACKKAPRRRWSSSGSFEHPNGPGPAEGAGDLAATRDGGGVATGDPVDFEHLRNAPVNESGVVFLFGIVSARLGYQIEAIQSRFPDCEARLKCDDGKWRRVRIEFEYESLNFVRHGHDVKGCDTIVCWKHNWPKCPVKVIELSSELARLAKAEKMPPRPPRRSKKHSPRRSKSPRRPSAHHNRTTGATRPKRRRQNR